MKQFFKDENGQYSSKRLAGLLCVLALVVSLVANTFSNETIKPSEALVNAVAMFAFSSLGLTTVEKFKK
jgi:hypothetical protein